MYCPHCGAKNEDTSQFCGECGSKLSTSGSAGQGSASEQLRSVLSGLSAGLSDARNKASERIGRVTQDVKAKAGETKEQFEAKKADRAAAKAKKDAVRQEKKVKRKEARKRFFKRLGIACAIAIPLLLIAAEAVNILLANSALSRLEKYVESGDVSSIALVSIDRDRLMYDEYIALLNVQLDDERYRNREEILQAIYKKTDISTEHVFPLWQKTTVKVSVRTINMEEVLDKTFAGTKDTMTNEQFKQLLLKNIADAEASDTYDCTILMRLNGSGWAVDTESYEFKDAISGGFYSAYSKLYNEAIEEFKEAARE